MCVSWANMAATPRDVHAVTTMFLFVCFSWRRHKMFGWTRSKIKTLQMFFCFSIWSLLSEINHKHNWFSMEQRWAEEVYLFVCFIQQRFNYPAWSCGRKRQKDWRDLKDNKNRTKNPNRSLMSGDFSKTLLDGGHTDVCRTLLLSN